MGIYKTSSDRNVGDFVEAAGASGNLVQADGSWKPKADYPALAAVMGDPTLFDGTITYNNSGSNNSFETFSDLAGGNNVVVMVGSSTMPTGYTVVMQSPDGKKWKRTAILAGTPTGVRRIFFVGGKFFVVTTTGTYASTDGLAFTKISSMVFARAAFNGTTWVLSLYNNNSPTTTYYTSTDLINFTSRSAPAGMLEVAYGGGNFVFVQNNSTNSYVSTDGVTWTAGGSTQENSKGRIQSANGVLFMPLDSLTIAYSSTDGGVTWNSCGSGKNYTTNDFDVYYDGDKYVINAMDGQYYYPYWYSTTPTGFSSVYAYNSSNWQVRTVYSGSFAITTFWNETAYVTAKFATGNPMSNNAPNWDANMYPLLWNRNSSSIIRKSKTGIKYQQCSMRDPQAYIWACVRIEGSDGYLHVVTKNGYNYLQQVQNSTDNNRFYVLDNGSEYSVFGVTTPDGYSNFTGKRFAVNKATFASTEYTLSLGMNSYSYFIEVGDGLLLAYDMYQTVSYYFNVDGTWDYTNFSSFNSGTYGTFIDSNSGVVIVSGNNSSSYACQVSTDGGKKFTWVYPKLYSATGSTVTLNSSFTAFFSNGFYYVSFGDKIYRGASLAALQESSTDMPMTTSEMYATPIIPIGKDIIAKVQMVWNGNGIKHKGNALSGLSNWSTIYTDSYPSVDNVRFLTVTYPTYDIARVQYVRYEKDPTLNFKVPVVASTTAGKSMCIVAK